MADLHFTHNKIIFYCSKFKYKRARDEQRAQARGAKTAGHSARQLTRRVHTTARSTDTLPAHHPRNER